MSKNKKQSISLLLVALFMGSILIVLAPDMPIATASTSQEINQSPALEEWMSSTARVIHNEDGSRTLIAYAGDQVIWNGSQYVEYIRETRNGNMVIRCPRVGVEITDSRLTVYDENMTIALADLSFELRRDDMNVPLETTSSMTFSDDSVILNMQSDANDGSDLSVEIILADEAKFSVSFRAGKNGRYKVAWIVTPRGTPSLSQTSRGLRFEREGRSLVAQWSDALEFFDRTTVKGSAISIEFADQEYLKDQMIEFDPTFYSQSSLDGFIEMGGQSYPPNSASVNTDYGGLFVGQAYVEATEWYYRECGYLSFDTSSIPSEAMVTDADLYLKQYLDYTDTDFYLEIYGGGTHPVLNLQPIYDDELTASDWHCGAGNAISYQERWHSSDYEAGVWLTWDIYQPEFQTNKNGKTQFELHSDREWGQEEPYDFEYASFYTADSAYDPYYVVDYELPYEIIKNPAVNDGSYWHNETLEDCEPSSWTTISANGLTSHIRKNEGMNLNTENWNDIDLWQPYGLGHAIQGYKFHGGVDGSGDPYVLGQGLNRYIYVPTDIADGDLILKYTARRTSGPTHTGNYPAGWTAAGPTTRIGGNLWFALKVKYWDDYRVPPEYRGKEVYLCPFCENNWGCPNILTLDIFADCWIYWGIPWKDLIDWYEWNSSAGIPPYGWGSQNWFSPDNQFLGSTEDWDYHASRVPEDAGFALNEWNTVEFDVGKYLKEFKAWHDSLCGQNTAAHATDWILSNGRWWALADLAPSNNILGSCRGEPCGHLQTYDITGFTLITAGPTTEVACAEQTGQIKDFHLYDYRNNGNPPTDPDFTSSIATWKNHPKQDGTCNAFEHTYSAPPAVLPYWHLPLNGSATVTTGTTNYAKIQVFNSTRPYESPIYPTHGQGGVGGWIQRTDDLVLLGIYANSTNPSKCWVQWQWTDWSPEHDGKHNFFIGIHGNMSRIDPPSEQYLTLDIKGNDDAFSYLYKIEIVDHQHDMVEGTDDESYCWIIRYPDVGILDSSLDYNVTVKLETNANQDPVYQKYGRFEQGCYWNTTTGKWTLGANQTDYSESLRGNIGFLFQLDFVGYSASPENLTAYTENDPNNRISLIDNYTVDFHSYNDENNEYLYKDKGSGNIGNFTHDFNVNLTSTQGLNSSAGLYAVSQSLGDFDDMGNKIAVRLSEDTFAEQLNCSIVKDSMVKEHYPTTNWGSSELLASTSYKIGTSSQNIRTYLSFDTSEIPSDAEITSALLKLYCYYETNLYDAKVYRITGAWNETDITWNNQPYDTTHGGDEIEITTTGWKEWDVMGIWANGDSIDFFVKATTEDSYPSKKGRYFSREHGSYEPYLEVTYTITKKHLKLDGTGFSTKQIEVPENTTSLYARVTRYNKTVELYLYNSSTRSHIIGDVSATLSENYTFRYTYACFGDDWFSGEGTTPMMRVKVFDLDLNENGGLP